MEQKIDYNVVNAQVADWIREYVSENGIKSLVIGVSGGIDSAVVSYLCGLTGIKTFAISMPIHQAESHLIRANNHIAWLKEHFSNVEGMTMDLSAQFDAVNNQLQAECLSNGSELCAANTRSRLRMNALYHIACAKYGIVVGTGNYIEDFVLGFCTKYGDHGVDISPIGQFYKSEVRDMARAACINQQIIDAPPSDGLWGDARSDEDQIGANYDELEEADRFMRNLWFNHSTWITKQQKNDCFEGVLNGEYKEGRMLTDRQKEVLRIYKKFNDKNHHKMVPAPMFMDVKTRM